MTIVNRYSRAATTLLFLFIAAIVSAIVAGCGDAGREHFKLDGATMGTHYHITVVERAELATNQRELQQAIDQQLALINEQMSTYRDDSELSQLNAAPVDQWVDVSANLFDVLVMSLELGWLSNGAFDITVGPLVNLWGFGPGGESGKVEVPSAARIAEQLALTGFQAIEFNLANSDIRKRRAVTLDLSAIAKGYAVDKVAELLIYAGYTDFMVEIGGELRLQGNSPRGTPWRIAIERPEAATLGRAHAAVSISNAGMATSGDYRNYFELDGKRYSHTIDPTTGYPIDHALASVTVIADSAAYADGLATAINVMGPELGMQLADQQGVAVYMIVKTEQIGRASCRERV